MLYLKHDVDLFPQRVSVDQSQLERNCIGVEEGAGLGAQQTAVSAFVFYHTIIMQQDPNTGAYC